MLHLYLRHFLPYSLNKLNFLLVGLITFSLCASLIAPLRQASAQNQCTIGCQATVPQTAEKNQPVPFAAETTTAGCTVAPAYEWEFGDGSARVTTQNTSHSFTLPGAYNWRLTTSAAQINTIAGGYGEMAPAKQAPFPSPTDIALDPKGRGFYVSVSSVHGNHVRFVNTSGADAVIGGMKIAAGTVQRLIGDGLSLEEKASGRNYDAGAPYGIAVSADGDFVYVLDSVGSSVHVYNASNETKSLCNITLEAGSATRLFPRDFNSLPRLGSSLRAIAIHPNTGEVYVTDATGGVNKVYKFSVCGDSLTVVAGNGTATRPDEAFVPGAATSIPLLQPSAIVFDLDGNLYLADSGHARVIKIDANGQTSLIAQFQFSFNRNPLPNGLAFVGNELYATLGNQQTIVRLSGQIPVIAGKESTGCDYTTDKCGDGGSALNAGFNMAGGTDQPPVVGIESDGKGLFVADQVNGERGRIRYVNLSPNSVIINDTGIASRAVDTVAGSGAQFPYENGLAISALLANPSGVAIDRNGNLFIADTLRGRLRFVNRGNAPVKIFADTSAEQTVQPGQMVSVNKDVGTAPESTMVNLASFENPQGLAITAQGLFVADSKKGPAILALQRRSGLIRFINTGSTAVTFFGNSSSPVVVAPGNIATIAGGGTDGNGNGNGAHALNARFIGPTDVGVSPVTGDIYIASVADQSVRKIDGQSGIVSSLAIPASGYTGLAFGKDGRLYIANESEGVVLRETAAGSGIFSPMNAESQRLVSPRDLAVDSDGNAYVTEVGNVIAPNPATGTRIARISPDGRVSTAAGQDGAGFDGDAGPALNAQINLQAPDFYVNLSGAALARMPATVGIVMGTDNELFFCDSNNSRIRHITGLNNHCSQSGVITITGDNPIPVLSTISPTSAVAGDPAFTLSVRGANFLPGSKIRWNGQERSTTYINSSRLTANIPASDLASAGQAEVTVFNPEPGGGVSTASSFTIAVRDNPLPVLLSLEPSMALAGSPEFTLTVKGDKFIPASVVRWAGMELPTSFVSDKELTVSVSAELLKKAATVQVNVFSPTPGGGTSLRLPFQIKPNSQPQLTGIDPNRLQANSLIGKSFEVTVTGESFLQTSTVLWNGAARPTRYVNSQQLVFSITNEDVLVPITIPVVVSNIESGGAISNALNFTITSAPTIRSISPNAVLAGSSTFTLRIFGSGFSAGNEVLVGGKARRTAYISFGELQALIEAEDIANAGVINIAVMGAPNGQLPRGVSNSVSLQVVNNSGGLASVSAASFNADSIAPESIVAAFGTGLATGIESASALPLPTTLAGTRVIVKDSQDVVRDAPLFFVSPTQINYLMPAGTASGLALVTVVSGGETSSSGYVQIAKVAPGIFTANSTGLGLVSGVALRVNGTGTPSFEPIVRYDSESQQFVPLPVDLGTASDQVYLVLFATGLRNRSDLSAVTVQIGGQVIPVTYAGEAPGLVGVDQINLGPLPRNLAGSGNLNLVVSVEGKMANTVQFTIK